MAGLTFRSDFDVTEIDSMGGDQRICQAARVSTKGAAAFDSEDSAGLINFLLANRHGSPFEHVVFTWLITAPIFLWREFYRHRHGAYTDSDDVSYNEESGRYREMEPVFYVPPPDRPLIQVGKPGEYRFSIGTSEQYREVKKTFELGAKHQYDDYQYLLGLGIAREVSRMELPLNIYSSAYVTMNARALMNFLSLRTQVVDLQNPTKFPSFPQWEIKQVAMEMENFFRRTCPLTHKFFNRNGRVQP